jgi:hypothetical protein
MPAFLEAIARSAAICDRMALVSRRARKWRAEQSGVVISVQDHALLLFLYYYHRRLDGWMALAFRVLVMGYCQLGRYGMTMLGREPTSIKFKHLVCIRSEMPVEKSGLDAIQAHMAASNHAVWFADLMSGRSFRSRVP